MNQKKYYKNDKIFKLKSTAIQFRDGFSPLILNSFPLMDDFEIKTKDCGKTMGTHVYFFSPKFGILASFPWWDHADNDLKQWDLNRIPLGDFDKPFWDMEQGWQLVIWKKRNYVYVMQGNDLNDYEFTAWFRVDEHRYSSEWEKILIQYQER